MTLTATQKEILTEWTRKGPLVNWLEMEKVQRAVLKEYKNGRFTPTEALRWLDEALAAYTRRGNELPSAKDGL